MYLEWYINRIVKKILQILAHLRKKMKTKMHIDGKHEIFFGVLLVCLTELYPKTQK